MLLQPRQPQPRQSLLKNAQASIHMSPMMFNKVHLARSIAQPCPARLDEGPHVHHLKQVQEQRAETVSTELKPPLPSLTLLLHKCKRALTSLCYRSRQCCVQVASLAADTHTAIFGVENTTTSASTSQLGSIHKPPYCSRCTGAQARQATQADMHHQFNHICIKKLYRNSHSYRTL